jgi:energy-coupling factor transporter transmembrane protein EcfT
MIKEYLILLDSLTLIFAFIVFLTCINIYKKVKGNGFLLITIAFLWMLIIRALWLSCTIVKCVWVKEILGSLTVTFWLLISIAFVIFERDIKKVIK